MGFVYVMAMTFVFCMVALVWALYDGHRLDHNVE